MRRPSLPHSQAYDVASGSASEHTSFHLLKLVHFNLGDSFGLMSTVVDCGDAVDVAIQVNYNKS